MPIDPSILNNLQTPKIEDPLARYSNYLAVQQAMNQQDEYQRGLKERDTANTVYRNALRGDGTVDETSLLQGYASQGLGYKIPDLRKGLLELKDKQAGIEKTKADTLLAGENAKKANLEAVGKALEFHHKALDGVQTPEQAVAWIRSQYSNPVLAQYHAIQGDTLEKDLGMLVNVAKAGKFDGWLTAMKLGSEKALENVYHTIDSGGKVDFVAARRFGTPNQTVVSSTPKTYDPSHPPQQTFVNVDAKGQTARQETIGKASGNRDESLFGAASSAPAEQRRLKELVDLIHSGKVITGAGANLKLNGLRLAAALGVAGKNDEETISNTQILIKQLAQNVWGKYLDLRASGVQIPRLTNQELTMMASATAGTNTLDPKTIEAIAKGSIEVQRATIGKWNQRYKELTPDEIRLGGYHPIQDVEVPGTSPAAASFPGAPPVGTVVDGHKYRGGNPKDPKNWIEVK